MKVVPCLSLEAGAIRALGAEPRLRERAGRASRVGRRRERGMLMSRTSLSLFSCRASRAVGLEHKIRVEVLDSKKTKNQQDPQTYTHPHTLEMQLEVILQLELKQCIFIV